MTWVRSLQRGAGIAPCRSASGRSCYGAMRYTLSKTRGLPYKNFESVDDDAIFAFDR